MILARKQKGNEQRIVLYYETKTFIYKCEVSVNRCILSYIRKDRRDIFIRSPSNGIISKVGKHNLDWKLEIRNSE